MFGVVEPGAAAACAVADASGVTVLATESTIAGGAYQRALLRSQPTLRVLGRPCPLWVTLAEQGSVASDLSDAILRTALAAYPIAGLFNVTLNIVVGVHPFSGVS